MNNTNNNNSTYGSAGSTSQPARSGNASTFNPNSSNAGRSNPPTYFGVAPPSAQAGRPSYHGSQQTFPLRPTPMSLDTNFGMTRNRQVSSTTDIRHGPNSEQTDEQYLNNRSRLPIIPLHPAIPLPPAPNSAISPGGTLGENTSDWFPAGESPKNSSTRHNGWR
nr:uncharacterized protein CI109_002587 [Kwoniella shandongensis]KAA5528830.1 hypothetical protein CI109_002587 [Kwoniella shandongensis]